MWPLNLTDRTPRGLFVAASLVTTVTVAIADYYTNPEISLSVFYLLALGLAAWFVGRGFAVFISLLSIALSLAGDLVTDARNADIVVLVWNASIVLAFYLVVVELITSLRALTAQLEARVTERTRALTDQMTERGRLERELIAISEQERRRIGHDLHDSLGQYLTGAALAGQVLEEKLGARGLPEARDAAKVVELIEDGIGLSRKLAKGLDPVEIEAGGLMSALEELAATSAEMFKISCTFECDSPVVIRDSAVAGHLYRIAQESVSNAVKHGKAAHVIINLDAGDDGVALRVTDDGAGFAATSAKTPGMGLRIMAHRASMIGAAFAIERDAARGAVITCRLQKGGAPENQIHERRA